MKYKVNDTCIACGMCAGTCPEVFRMNDDTGMAEAYYLPVVVIVSRCLCPVGGNPGIGAQLYHAERDCRSGIIIAGEAIGYCSCTDKGVYPFYGGLVGMYRCPDADTDSKCQC